MSTTLIIDDAVIQAVRDVKHKFAKECEYKPAKMAEEIRKKRQQLAKCFGLKTRTESTSDVSDDC